MRDGLIAGEFPRMLTPMSNKTAPSDLTGSLLIAMPGMADPNFAGSLVFLCSHSPDGAMGLVINRQVPDVTLGNMLSQLELEVTPRFEGGPVFYGGPVETNRGFILHDSTTRRARPSASDGDSFLRVNEHFAMSSTVDVLEDIGAGRGPKRSLVMLGYAGWGAQQLEAEIALNGWLTCQALPDLVFSDDVDSKWDRALSTLGVDPLLLSTQAGRA